MKINRNFGKIAVLSLFFLLGFNEWGTFPFANGVDHRQTRDFPDLTAGKDDALPLYPPNEQKVLLSRGQWPESTSSTGLRSMLHSLSRVNQQSKFWEGLPLERMKRYREKTPLFPDLNDQSDLRYPFWGTLKQVEIVPLSDADHGHEPSSRAYRCTIAMKGAESESRDIVVYTLSLPSFEINRDGRLFDTARNDLTADSFPRGIGQTVGGIGFLMGEESRREKIPVLTAANIGWFPDDHLLGQLGMNVASLESAPVYSPKAISALSDKKTSEHISPEERQKIIASLRLTRRDRNPFYELLSTGMHDHAEQLIHNALASPTRKTNEPEYMNVVELFNRPQNHQGQLVRLRGHARRVERIPVADEEIRKRFGIDSYYQLFFYTPDSQGNPLALCVTELPQGMPTGSDNHYKEEIILESFFYKSWAWRISRLPDDYSTNTSGQATSRTSTDDSQAHAWIKAPLLVGGTLRWIEQPSPKQSPPPVPIRVIYTGFFILVFAYFLYRSVRPIIWKKYK